jgi:hypothetical protein
MAMQQTAFRLDVIDFDLLDDVVQHQLLGVGDRSTALRFILRQYAKDAARYNALVGCRLPERSEICDGLKAKASDSHP